jgi:hypothetical protein
LAWSGFIKQVQRMARHQLRADAASHFFAAVLQDGSTHVSSKVERELQTVAALFGSAPGQKLPSADGTVWGAVNAVTYYADHVRSGSDRLECSWFGAGAALKNKAWAKAVELIA